jgi:hypothetical protein
MAQSSRQDKSSPTRRSEYKIDDTGFGVRAAVEVFVCIPSDEQLIKVVNNRTGSNWPEKHAR